MNSAFTSILDAWCALERDESGNLIEASLGVDNFFRSTFGCDSPQGGLWLQACSALAQSPPVLNRSIELSDFPYLSILTNDKSLRRVVQPAFAMLQIAFDLNQKKGTHIDEDISRLAEKFLVPRRQLELFATEVLGDRQTSSNNYAPTSVSVVFIESSTLSSVGYGSGFLARLYVRAIPGGTGLVYPAPTHSFFHLDDAFCNAIEIAKQVSLLDIRDVDICWWLVRTDGRNLSWTITGESMGAALALATCSALADNYVDQNPPKSPDVLAHESLKMLPVALRGLDLSTLIVTARLDNSGKLHPVEGTWEKITAAASEAIRSGCANYFLTSNNQELPNEFKTHRILKTLQAESLPEAALKLQRVHGPYMAVCDYERDRPDRNDPLDPSANESDFFSLHYQPPQLCLEKEAGVQLGANMEVSISAIENLLQDALSRQHVNADTIGELRKIVQHSQSAAKREYVDRLVRLFSENEVRMAPRVAIVGAPGSGKTMLERYLAFHAVSDKNGEPNPVFGTPLIPVRVRLRNWQVWGRKNDFCLTNYLLFDSPYRDLIPCPSESDWLHWFRSGQVLLLLDGLDEIDPEPNGKFLTEGLLPTIRGTAKSCPIVVTCRTNNFEAHRSVCADFGIYHLAPLDHWQWEEIVRTYPSESLNKRAFVSQVQNDSSLLKLAGNPMLLKIMLLVATSRQGSLPNSRAELYHEAVNLVLNRGSQETSAAKRALLRDAIEKTALKLLKGSEGRSELHFTAGELQQAVQEAALENSAVNTEELQNYLETSGLVRTEGSDRSFFVHLTIHEFLAGAAISRLEPKTLAEYFANYIPSPRWREPLRFCLGAVRFADKNEKKINAAVDAILSLEDPLPPRATVFLYGAMQASGNLPRMVVRRIFQSLALAYAISRNKGRKQIGMQRIEALFSLADGIGNAAEMCYALRPLIDSDSDEAACAAAILVHRMWTSTPGPSTLPSLIIAPLAETLCRRSLNRSRPTVVEVDRAFRIIVSRSADNATYLKELKFRESLQKQPHLEAKLKSSQALLGVAIALYGGLNASNHIDQLYLAEEESALNGKLASLPNDESIGRKYINERLATLKEMQSSISKEMHNFCSSQIHRESAFVTKPLIACLMEEISIDAFCKSLTLIANGHSEIGKPTARDRADAIFSLSLLDPGLEIELEKGVAAELRALITILGGELAPGMKASKGALLKDVPEIVEPDGWIDLIDAACQLQSEFGLAPKNFIEWIGAAPPELKSLVLGQCWSVHMSGDSEDPLYNLCVTLDSLGKVLSNPQNLLPSLALAGFMLPAPRNEKHKWRFDRLSLVPNLHFDKFTIGLAIDSVLSFAPGMRELVFLWLLRKAAKTFVEQGFAKEVEILANWLIEDRYNLQCEAMKALEEAQKSVHQIDECTLNSFRRCFVALGLNVSDHVQREKELNVLEGLASSLEIPDERFWALERLAAWKVTHGENQDVTSLLEAAREILNPENKARALAKASFYLSPAERQAISDELVRSVNDVPSAGRRNRLLSVLDSADSSALDQLHSHLFDNASNFGEESIPFLLGIRIAKWNRKLAEGNELQLWKLVTSGNTEAVSELEDRLAARLPPLTLQSALAIDQIIATKRTAEAERLMRFFNGAEVCCLPFLSRWRHTEMRIASSLLTAETIDLNESLISDVADSYENSQEDDSTRFRSAVALYGSSSGFPPMPASALGSDGFYALVDRLSSQNAISSPGVTLGYHWATDRIQFQNPDFLKKVVRQANTAPGTEWSRNVLSSIKAMSSASLLALLDMLDEVESETSIELIARLAEMAVCKRYRANELREIVLPRLQKVSSEILKRLVFLPNPFGETVAAAQSAAIHLRKGDLTTIGDAFFFAVRQLESRLIDLSRLDNCSSEEAETLLLGFGDQFRVNDRFRLGIADASSFVETTPGDLDFLIRWLANRLESSPPENRNVGNPIRLIENLTLVIDAASARMRALYSANEIVKSTEFAQRLAAIGLSYHSYPVRAAAFRLLGRRGRFEPEIAAAIRNAFRDVSAVQFAVISSTKEYTFVEQGFLNELFDGLQDNSPAVIYVTAHILGAIARADGSDPETSDLILKKIQLASLSPSADLPVFVLADSEVGRGIVYRGTVREALERIVTDTWG